MKELLNMINDVNVFTTLTICGSYRFRELKEKYQAFYTLKNNLVLMPINYMSIKNEVETTKEVKENNKNIMANIHDIKIKLADAIIVVNGTNENNHVGTDTMREIIFAYDNEKKVLFTHIPNEDKDKYYFNGNRTYPLYILKEEYK